MHRRPPSRSTTSKAADSSFTDAGRDMVHTIDTTDDPAPERLSGLDEAELRKLQAILVKLAGD